MKFALAGNPNSGKTTLFNTLTGSTAHVGNWPGVTVDKREGVYKKLPERVTILDLPGIYSLSPYTPEEVVSRQYIIEEAPDVIINIVDATSLERGLYLTTQLLESDRPVIVALNMMDSIKSNGDTLDSAELERLLGVPVVEISALRRKGIPELMRRAYELAGTTREPMTVLKASPALQGLIITMEAALQKEKAKNALFTAIKLVEGDEIECKKYPTLTATAEKLKKDKKEDVFQGDYEGIVADARYKYITANWAGVHQRAVAAGGVTRSHKADKVLTHKWFGIPIFIVIMFGMFHIIFSENFLFLSIYGVDPIPSLGVWLQGLLGDLTGLGIGAVEGAMETSAEWARSMVVDGLLGGIDAVLSFLPQLLLLYLFLSILEDTGYMARVAFLLDKVFRRFGLSGRALLPLLMCFGCAVPGIMATKGLDDEKERKTAVYVSPFFSCGAKMPIWAVFAATVFAGRGGEFVVFGMYLLGIGIAVIAAFIMNKRSRNGAPPEYLMELPAYHLPQFQSTMMFMWEKFKHYITRVTTVIAGSVLVIWFLQSFSFSFQFVENSADSILGILAQGLRYLFVPLGFGMGEHGWKFVVAAFTGLIAKELVVGTLGVFAGTDGDAVIDGDAEATGSIGAFLAVGLVSWQAAVAFMAFNLLAVPCMAAVGAARSQLQDKKSFWTAIGIWLGTAYLVSMILYWTLSYWYIGLTFLLLAAACITVYVLNDKGIINLKALFKKKAAAKREE